MLNTLAFALVEARPDGAAHILEAYRPRYASATMILYSRGADAAPLVALTVLANHTTHAKFTDRADAGTARSLVTRRFPPPGSTVDTEGRVYFQAMLDRAGAEFTVLLTNLDADGWVNVNLLRDSGTRVTNNDPGGAVSVNAVNELAPAETYAVQCDQRTGRALVLEDARVTVREDAMAVDAARGGTGDVTTSSGVRGTHLFISVNPERGHAAQRARFDAGTAWHTSGVFVRRRAVPPHFELREDPAMSRSFGSAGVYGGAGPFGGFGSAGVAAPPQAATFGAPIPAGTPFSFGRSSATVAAPAASAPIAPSTLVYAHPPPQPAFSFSSASRGYAVATAASSAAREASFSHYFDDRNVPRALDRAAGPPRATAAGSAPQNVIDASSTARLASGARAVHEVVRATGREYDYEVRAQPCVLGFSIWPATGVTLCDAASDDDVVAEARVLLDECAARGARALLAALARVYATDECTLCLEAAPDSVYYACGHACVHAACEPVPPLAKCPLCRAHVAARAHRE